MSLLKFYFAHFSQFCQMLKGGQIVSVFSTEKQEKFIILRDNGHSLEEISKILQVDLDKLVHWDISLTQEPEINICEELEKQRIRENI